MIQIGTETLVISNKVGLHDIEDVVFKITGSKILFDNLDSKILDYGIDSLNFLEIVIELEDRLGKRFDDDTIFMCKTIGDLLHLIK